MYRSSSGHQRHCKKHLEKFKTTTYSGGTYFKTFSVSGKHSSKNAKIVQSILEYSERNGTIDNGDKPQWEEIFTTHDLVEDETDWQINPNVDSPTDSDVVLNVADKDGKPMEPNFAALKVQKIMEKEFHGDKLPINTRGGKALLHAEDYVDEDEGILLPHLRKNDDNASELRDDFRKCRPEDYVMLAKLSTIFEISDNGGNQLLEILNNIMRENEIAFRFPKTWKTILDSMRPCKDHLKQLPKNDKEVIQQFTAPFRSQFHFDQVLLGCFSLLMLYIVSHYSFKFISFIGEEMYTAKSSVQKNAWQYLMESYLMSSE